MLLPPDDNGLLTATVVNLVQTPCQLWKHLAQLPQQCKKLLSKRVVLLPALVAFPLDLFHTALMILSTRFPIGAIRADGFGHLLTLGSFLLLLREELLQKCDYLSQPFRGSV